MEHNKGFVSFTNIVIALLLFVFAIVYFPALAVMRLLVSFSPMRVKHNNPFNVGLYAIVMGITMFVVYASYFGKGW